MKKTRITAIFGTRPEAIKMCPLMIELRKRENIDLRIILSGQHRDMCREVTDYFGVSPHKDLDVMTDGQSLNDLTERILSGASRELSEHPTDILLVHGDTATAFASALAAFYAGVRVGHVEAGLRTNDQFTPFPEEFYRRSIDAMSFCHFCPTVSSADNLIREGIPRERIFITGNTVVDALSFTLSFLPERDESSRPLLLVTIHRRESRGQDMRNILSAVRRAAEKIPEIRIVIPVHPSPQTQLAVNDVFGDGISNVNICPPLSLPDFHKLIHQSHLILTDSGGIQEEAVTLRRHLLLARDSTERPEGIESGFITLVGKNEDKIFTAICDYFRAYPKALPVLPENPFGTGDASKKIADALLSIPLEKSEAI